MQFLIDTANLEEIKRLNDYAPIEGVTTNPSIIKNEGDVCFYSHLRAIREVIGFDKTLHVQVVAADYEGMMEDAEAILENVDQDVYIKIPVTADGLKAIKALKARGVNVTATAIYTKMQAYLAIAAKADYVAPYFNRMENLNIDPVAVIQSIADTIQRTSSQTQVLAASFKNVNQVIKSYEAGAQTATMAVDIIETALAMPSISQAVEGFKADWEAIHGEGQTVASLSAIAKSAI